MKQTIKDLDLIFPPFLGYSIHSSTTAIPSVIKMILRKTIEPYSLNIGVCILSSNFTCCVFLLKFILRWFIYIKSAQAPDIARLQLWSCPCVPSPSHWNEYSPWHTTSISLSIWVNDNRGFRKTIGLHFLSYPKVPESHNLGAIARWRLGE